MKGDWKLKILFNAAACFFIAMPEMSLAQDGVSIVVPEHDPEVQSGYWHCSAYSVIDGKRNDFISEALNTTETYDFDTTTPLERRFRSYLVESNLSQGNEIHSVSCSRQIELDHAKTVYNEKKRSKYSVYVEVKGFWRSNQAFSILNVGKSDKSGLKRVTINFVNTILDSKNRYEGSQIEVEYKFILCGRDIHIAYSLDPESFQSKGYRYKGTIHKVEARPSLSSIWFGGLVKAQLPGSPSAFFSDKIAGRAISFDCFSGQSQKLVNANAWFPNNATQQDVEDAMENFVVITDSRAPYRSPEAEAEIEGIREKQESDEVARLNAEALARAQSQDKKRLADQAEYAAQMEKTKSAQAQYENDRLKYENALKAVESAKQKYEEQMKQYKNTVGIK